MGARQIAEQQRVEAIYAALQKANPAPTTELEYSTPFQLLIAVVLSAQATDKGVNKATRLFFDKIQTPQQLLAWGETNLLQAIKSIGLYKTKGKNVLALSHQLIEKHNGEVPKTRQELEALPGVGRKTANVILNTLYDEPTLAVDTHVFRVAHRLGFSKGTTPAKVEADLLRITPLSYLNLAHHWLILHGRYICVARTPKCRECPVSNFCPSYEIFMQNGKVSER